LLLSCGPHPLPDPLITDPAQLIAGISAPLDDTFLGEARIEYYGDGMARKGKMTVMSRPPDALRLDAYTFTDDLISLLVLKGGRFVYFERGRKECFQGPLCAAPMVARFPGVGAPERLLPLLAGRLPVMDEGGETRLHFDRKEGVYLLTVDRGSVTQAVKVMPDGRTVVEAEVREEGKVVLRLLFSGRLDVEGRTIPRHIRLVAPREKLDLSVEYRDAEFGYEFKSDPFQFECPRGTRAVTLGCDKE